MRIWTCVWLSILEVKALFYRSTIIVNISFGNDSKRTNREGEYEFLRNKKQVGQ